LAGQSSFIKFLDEEESEKTAARKNVIHEKQKNRSRERPSKNSPV